MLLCSRFRRVLSVLWFTKMSGVVGVFVVLSKLLFVLSKSLVTVEVSVFVERMREEDKRERLERQYLLFTQPLFHAPPPPPHPTRAIESPKNTTDFARVFSKSMWTL
jgi:hypothetical protein